MLFLTVFQQYRIIIDSILFLNLKKKDNLTCKSMFQVDKIF